MNEARTGFPLKSFVLTIGAIAIFNAVEPALRRSPSVALAIAVVALVAQLVWSYRWTRSRGGSASRAALCAVVAGLATVLAFVGIWSERPIFFFAFLPVAILGRRLDPKDKATAAPVSGD